MEDHRVLDGVVVLDFTHVLAGPYCTRLMCDLGAEVIKIERPGGGDMARSLPFVIKEGYTGYYMQLNWGKKSVAIDLKHEKGREIIVALSRSADVVVENFRAGTMQKLRLGYGDLSTINPRLVMCSISAFGQTGPYADRPGHGLMAEALSGTLDMTGEPEGSPQILGIAAADVNGGTHAFGAIMAALFKRQLTGKGCYIDIALSDCLFGYHEISFQQYILSRGTVTPRRSGTNLPSVVPYGIFRARDGFIAIAVASEPVWARLARAMGDVELVEKYPSNEVRVQKKREVLALVQAWVSSFKSAADVLEVLVRQEVPCGKLLSIPEVLEDPHVRARNMFVDVEVPVVGRTLLMNTPFKFDRWTAGPRGGPARLGQHTREVLCSRLGLPEAAFRELQGQGVVEVPAVE